MKHEADLQKAEAFKKNILPATILYGIAKNQKSNSWLS